MKEANKAMYRTLDDLGDRCEARARHTETLLSEMRLRATQPVLVTAPLTIQDVLAGHRRQ